MPQCKKCNEHFPNLVIIKGKKRGLYGRKYCLDCSPFGKHNTRQLEVDPFPSEKKCSGCGETKPISEFHERKDRDGYYSNCKQCSSFRSYMKSKKRGVDRKLCLIQLFGGACEECGYNKNWSALTFHHINPQKKEFSLGTTSIRSRPWEKCVEEAKKCKLLCCNCHTEEHYPRRSYSSKRGRQR